jgi:pSer/pThr/pTyr-binding forkhead associated (FHA) protein
MAPKNAPSRPDPRLSGPSGLRLLLDGGAARWVVGRGPSADLVVHDPDMSREHFEVVRARDGSFRISDLESKNGIFLNGSRARSFAIEPGDEVQAGGTVLRFEV